MFRGTLIMILTMLPTALAHPPGLTVMSYNIRHGESASGALELEAIADVIRAHDPDIIGLQEVDRHFSERSDFRDQTADLARTLGMNHCFGANLDSESETPGQPRSQYGTAILSPHPLTTCHNTRLPRRGEDEQRGLLSAKVMLEGQAFYVYNTHLQHDSETARLEQVDAILSEIPTDARKTVLLGDLNATPETREVEALLRRFADSWSAGRGNGFTYPAEAPESRIDYLLATPDLRAVRTTVPHTEASDHRPVVAVFARD